MNTHSVLFDDADTKPCFKIAKASLELQTRQNINSSTLDLLQQSLTKPEQAQNTDEDEDEYHDNENASEKRKREEEEVRVRVSADGEKRMKRKVPMAKKLEMARRLREMKRENPAAKTPMKMNPSKMIDHIKRDQRQRVKSAENWKERVERTNKIKSDRQRKRPDNIAKRAKDKKATKIAKRTNKMKSAGVPGRKEGYITKT